MADGERAKRFGSTLGKARQRADNISQSTLGAAIGTPQSTISSWERGESEPPADMVFKMEKALDLRPGTLSRLLGYLPIDGEQISGVESAIMCDPTLDPYKRTLLISIYETMRET